MDEERAREISEKADGAIQGHGDLLKGCRGALRDYLAQRVDSATRQYAYVQKIAGWREGTERNVFQKPNGTGVPPPEQTRFLAAALNELLATDEGKMKWPVGDIRNLRTKVRILVENDYGDKPWNNGGVGQASGAEPGRHPKSGRRPDGHAYEG